MDSPLLNALRYAGESLDKPGAAVRGLLAGDTGALANLIPFSDTLGITDPAQRVSGRGLLERAGALDPPDGGFGLGDVAGMGVEMALDPVNLLGGGLLKRALGGRAAAAESNALREAMLAKGAMPEEVAALTKVRNEAGPIRTYHGTPHVYDVPDPAKFGPNELYGPGYYTTEGPALASEYAESMAQPVERKLADAAFAAKQAREVLGRARERAAAGDPWWIESLPIYEKSAAEQEARLAATTGPAQNVRMQYIDARNPFDVDGSVPLENVIQSLGGDPAVRHRLASTYWGSDVIPGEDAWKLLSERYPVKTARTAALSDAGFDAITHLPGRGSAAAAGDDAAKAAERVWIALHPDQVYAPWIAPAAQTPPRLSPILAALAGQNAIRPMGHLGP